MYKCLTSLSGLLIISHVFYQRSNNVKIPYFCVRAVAKVSFISKSVPFFSLLSDTLTKNFPKILDLGWVGERDRAACKCYRCCRDRLQRNNISSTRVSLWSFWSPVCYYFAFERGMNTFFSTAGLFQIKRAHLGVCERDFQRTCWRYHRERRTWLWGGAEISPCCVCTTCFFEQRWIFWYHFESPTVHFPRNFKWESAYLCYCVVGGGNWILHRSFFNITFMYPQGATREWIIKKRILLNGWKKESTYY